MTHDEKKARTEFILMLGLSMVGLYAAFKEHGNYAGVFGGVMFGYFLAEAQRLANTRRKALLDAKKTPEPKLLERDERAVSPVIGVILMVAITVVLAAVVFVLVMNLSHNGAVQAPHVAITSDGRGNYTVVQADTALPWADLLLGCGPGQPAPTMTVGGTYVAAGDRARCSATGHLSIVHRPSNALIYSDN